MCVSKRQVSHSELTLPQEAIQAAFPDAWEMLARSPYPGLRVKARGTLVTTARTTAKAACKVTQPKPRPLSTHKATDEVARTPGTGPPKATCSARLEGLPLLTRKHLHPL